MRLLILGGTRFLGRHIVDAAQVQGHEITLFNRGESNADIFPTVEKLRGDRDGGLDTLRGRRWDAVIDTCGYVPRLVEDSAQLLADSVEHYTFISSISVYDDLALVGMDEDAPVGTLEDETTEEITVQSYGPLKVLCEQVAEDAMPGRVLTIRPGLIVGPHDPTDRFTYWPWRIQQGGRILAPDHADRCTQFVDGRDLARWTVEMVEQRATGIYNATGPETPLTLGTLFSACQSITGSDAELIWANEPFLQEQEVRPYLDLPLWVPQAMDGMNQANCQKAIDSGLTFRPLAKTIQDTLTWHAELPSDREWQAGLTRDRETELLRIFGEL